MKSSKKLIHIAKHTPTGAHVPVVVGKVDKDNIIENYKEWMEGRKGFTLAMLEKRWDKSKEEVIELLQKYQVPAHINHKEVQQLPTGTSPVEIAIFFEEYIFGIEKKSKIPYKKIKSKKLSSMAPH